ncbi:hypothetical protein VEGS20_44870 (plasmid) [Escherichia coli]|nr:hypothetical protein VEGS20_44870 [Escherichia coli]
MDINLLLKAIVAVILALWAADALRTKRKKSIATLLLQTLMPENAINGAMPDGVTVNTDRMCIIFRPISY